LHQVGLENRFILKMHGHTNIKFTKTFFSLSLVWKLSEDRTESLKDADQNQRI